jgi:glutathione synthase/RimK-type ligase-like ATP-grasp enzyme
MILVCGIPSEAPTRLVLEAASHLGVEAISLSQRLASDCGLEVGWQAGRMVAQLHGRDGVVDLDAATGAFVRLADYRMLPEFRRDSPDAVRTRIQIEGWHALLNDWLEAAPILVMNRLRPSSTNMSKPYQAQLITRAGFRVPQTLVTNEAARVLEFRRRCGRIIYKSISAQRSIVREFTDAEIPRLERIRYLPTQFQELVPGDDVRVHVAGTALFATQVESDVVDYRYATLDGGSAKFQPTRLPPEVTARCFHLARALDLPLCGIDLKRTPDQQYVCFEVNPAPAFSCYEEQTGQPIAAAIVRALAA